jgi:hypothetical protein
MTAKLPPPTPTHEAYATLSQPDFPTWVASDLCARNTQYWEEVPPMGKELRHTDRSTHVVKIPAPVTRAAGRGKRQARRGQVTVAETGGDAPRKRGGRDSWVQCDQCHKWRMLPLGIVLSEGDAAWICSMNPDPGYADCSAS